MQSLKDAKARTRQTLDDAQPPPPSMPAPSAPAAARDPAPEPVTPPAEGGNLAGQLLKRRKSRGE
jgi:hypothetical protein